MYKTFIGIVAVAFSLVFSPIASADSWGCGKGLKSMVESLKLEDAQKEKIKPILEQLEASKKDSWTQMKDLDKQLHQQFESATMDQDTVDGLVEKKVKLIGDMMKAKIAAKTQILAILNTEQKAELKNMMKKKEEKMAEKFKNCRED